MTATVVLEKFDSRLTDDMLTDGRLTDDMLTDSRLTSSSTPVDYCNSARNSPLVVVVGGVGHDSRQVQWLCWCVG